MRTGVVYAAALLLLVGCVRPQGSLPRAVQQERARLNVDRYRVLTAGLGAVGDGYTFLNARFRFEFAKDLDDVRGFETPESRYERGEAASRILNGGYEFVRDLFGIEAPNVIRVVIRRDIDGDPNDASTSIQWETRGGNIVEGSQKATMTFGIAAFQRPSVLAHELTHVLLGVYPLPAWLNEGIATLVQADYAHGAPWVQELASLEPIGLDADGYNLLQTWRGDHSPLPFRSNETYASAYAIVKEMQRRYGTDIFARLLQEFDKTKANLRGPRLTASDMINAIGRLTGKDARQFFEEIRFNVDERP